jgi:hypothetical protein
MALGIMMDLRGTMQITMGNNGDVMMEGIFYFLLFLSALVGGGEGVGVGDDMGKHIGE